MHLQNFLPRLSLLCEVSKISFSWHKKFLTLNIEVDEAEAEAEKDPFFMSVKEMNTKKKSKGIKEIWEIEIKQKDEGDMGNRRD